MESFRYNILLQRPEFFRPVENSFYEVWREGEPRSGSLRDEEVQDWISQTGRFASQGSTQEGRSRGAIRLIFGQPLPNQDLSMPWTGLRSANDVKIPFSARAFNSLVRQCKLPQQLLEAFERYTTAGFCARFTTMDEIDGKPNSTSFLGMMRLLSSDPCFLAYSYDEHTRITTGVILQASHAEQTDIKASLNYQKPHLGQELLLPTIFVDVNLHGGAEHLFSVKQRVLAVERMTDQHTWAGQTSEVDRLSDVELSKRAHGLQIEVAVSYRKIKVISLWIDLLLGVFKSAGADKKTLPSKAAGAEEAHSVKQWIEAMEAQRKMQVLDVEFLERRAANQTAAVYSLFSQRDNLANLSAAVESKKVAEAAKRDSSAMKSIAILTAFFFPGTFIATLFTLDSVKSLSFWVYWAITIPLTIVTLGSWGLYTRYQSRIIARRELELDRAEEGERKRVA